MSLFFNCDVTLQTTFLHDPESHLAPKHWPGAPNYCNQGPPGYPDQVHTMNLKTILMFFHFLVQLTRKIQDTTLPDVNQSDKKLRKIFSLVNFVSMIKIFNLNSVQISIENSKPFTLFQTCSPCQIKTILCWHPVKPNLTRWSYSILTKPNPAQPNSIQYIVYRIEIVISIIISHFKTFNIFSSVKGNTYPSKISEVHWGAQFPQFKNAHLPRKFTNF